MKKQTRKIALNRETVRTLNSDGLAGIRGGEVNISYVYGCLSTSYHAGVCNSGQQSCYPADCTISTSG